MLASQFLMLEEFMCGFILLDRKEHGLFHERPLIGTELARIDLRVRELPCLGNVCAVQFKAL
jgi:hypothetical protein